MSALSFATTHQKVVVALIAGLTIISISGIFAYSQRKNTADATEQLSMQGEQAPKDTGDADEDGAPDWQEILYGTNPKVKDTDGDGTEDKEEIDAMKKAREQDFIDAVAGNSPSNITTTELAADRLVGAYILQQQSSGGEVPVKDKDAIVKSTIQTLNQLKYTQYTTEEIVTTPDTSKASALRYRTAVQGKLEPLRTIEEYELQTYARAVDANDVEGFKKLKDASGVYSSVAKELLNVPVPTDVAEYHLQFINSFMYMSVALDGMSKGYDDVIGSYRALGHFGKAERQFKMAQEALRVYFTLKDIDSL